MVTERDSGTETLDEGCQTRSHHCTHAVYHYFDDKSTKVATIDDLVRFIREQTTKDTDENSVAVRLHHVTFPRLAEAGMIDYDPRSNIARYRGQQQGTSTMRTVRCETCGENQEMNLVEEPNPPCENCGNRALTRVDGETF